MANGDQLKRKVGLDEENDIAPAEHSFGGKKYLLSIGINYTGSVPAVTILNKAEDDANAFADELEKNYGFEPENVTRLIGPKANKEAITTAIGGYEQLTEKDSLVVFFAGHGVDKYWIPFNGNPDQLFNTSVQISAVIDGLFSFKCAQVLIIVDCCFAGKASDRAAMEALINKASEPKQFYVLTSSVDQPTGDSSLFFQYLMKILKEEELENFSLLLFWMQKNEIIWKSLSKSNPIAEIHPLPFVLQKKTDPVKPKFKSACQNLNFKVQKDLVGDPMFRKFNLIYLHGTSLCAHHLMAQYMLDRRKVGIDVLNLIPKIAKMNKNEGVSGKKIWQLFVNGPDLQDSSLNFIAYLINKTEQGNQRAFFVKISETYEDEADTLSSDLLEFWEGVNNLYTSNVITNNNTRHYFFILDERGSKGQINIDLIKSKTFDPNLKIFPLGTIEQLNTEILNDWKLNYEVDIDTKAFINYKFDSYNEADFYLYNAIAKLCEDFKYPDIANDLLIK